MLVPAAILRQTPPRRRRRFWDKLPGMQFEVEVYRNEAGEWVAEAVEYKVTAKGLTEKEALARVMDALTHHLKSAGKPSA